MRKLERAGVIVLVVIAACLAAWWAYGPRSASAPWPFRTAQAPTLRITFDGGGRITDYIERYSALRLSGGRVVIDGMCISACTIVTALMPAERVCATPYAQLAFHSAAQINPMTGERAHSPEGTRLVWNLYPETLRALLRAKSWDGEDAKANEHPDLIYVAGDELRAIIRPCAVDEM
jgi:hypothetical protein